MQVEKWKKVRRSVVVVAFECDFIYKVEKCSRAGLSILNINSLQVLYETNYLATSSSTKCKLANCHHQLANAHLHLSRGFFSKAIFHLQSISFRQNDLVRCVAVLLLKEKKGICNEIVGRKLLRYAQLVSIWVCVCAWQLKTF